MNIDRKKALDKLLKDMDEKVGGGLYPIDLALIFLEEELGRSRNGNLKSTKIDEFSVDRSPTTMSINFNIKWHQTMEEIVSRNI
jgi:hypothetical protein